MKITEQAKVEIEKILSENEGKLLRVYMAGFG